MGNIESHLLAAHEKIRSAIPRVDVCVFPETNCDNHTVYATMRRLRGMRFLAAMRSRQRSITGERGEEQGRPPPRSTAAPTAAS